MAASATVGWDGLTLETPRLLLRPPRQVDLGGWAAFMADEATARFVGGVQSRAEAWRGLAAAAGSWALLGFGMFSVIEKASGQWVGRVGPINPEGWPAPEIGWGIARDHWGKGFATESAAAAMDWACEVLDWSDVIHCIDPANSASAAVALRLGSSKRRPGRLPPPFESHEIEIWGQTREEWRRNRLAHRDER